MIRGMGYLFLLVCALGVEAAPLTSADLVNLSGRQRMLSQRIVKAYVQVGTKVAPDQSRQILGDSVDQFSSQLAQLRAIITKPEQKLVLMEIERLWPDVQGLASKTASRELAPALQERANELQTLCHRLAGLIENDAGLAIGRLVNVAGRQRMLSQRLAKAYMLRAWGVDSPQLGEELKSSRLEFSAALQLLAQASENTPEIRHELDLIVSQWAWFQTALELEGAFSYRLLVADSSESMLANLEKLVTLYTRLGK